MSSLITENIFSPIDEITTVNRRNAIRYTYACNTAIVIYKQRFMPTKYIKIKVINISSTGALISSNYKLPNKAKLFFKIIIKCNSPSCKSTWRVAAKVVRTYNKSEFGIVFDTIQHNLIDEIMGSETDFSLAL